MAQQSRTAKVPLSFYVMTEGADPQAPVHLFLKGEEAELKPLVEQLGGHYKYTYKQYGAVILPVQAVSTLDAAPEIEAVHFEYGKGEVLLSHSRYQTRIQDVHDGTGGLPDTYKGQDVIMGIIDAGIDLDHPDFQFSDGRTRVIELWDQTMGYSAQRTPTYGYGQVWDSADINANICPHQDQSSYFGHGTNTAGIAAGNGQSNAEFAGCAPDADLIIVSSNFNSFSWTFTVADAVDYIFARAEALGKACVINASLGNYGGAHDARDIATQLIENRISETSGRAMVCAAGNSGDSDPYHLGYEATADTNFTWFKTAPNASIGNGVIFFEVYGNVGDFESVQFSIGADQVSPDYAFRGSVNFDSIENRIGITYTEDFNSISGNYLGNIQTWADSSNGTYRLQFYLNNIDSVQYNYRLMITGGGRLDVWSGALIGTVGMLHSNLPSTNDFPDMSNYVLPDLEQSIVGYWACSDKVITTGNYVNRTTYTDVDGNTVSFSSLTAGNIAASSSSGPSRLGSVKPEVVAPGELTLAPGASFQIAAQLANSGQRERVASGGMHHRAGGTSSASPVVAATAALFFEKCPQASWSDFKEALIAGTVQDPFTQQTPNSLWGYGKLDAVNTLSYHTPHPALLADDNEFCEGESLQIALAQGYPSIEWTTGQTTLGIDVTQSGVYYAELYSEQGCHGFSDTLVVVKRPNPIKPEVSMAGSNPHCFNETVALAIDNSYGAYAWSNGAATHAVEVQEAGSYFCEVRNEYDCMNVSDTVEVTFHPGRDQPELHFQSGDVLQLIHDSLPVTGYRWYVNGTLDALLADSTVQVDKSGYYQGAFLDEYGCEWRSNEINVYALGAVSAGHEHVRIYPSPFSDRIHLSGLKDGSHWQLMDLLGRTALQGVSSQPSFDISTESLPSGSYILTVSSGGHTHHRAMLKQ